MKQIGSKKTRKKANIVSRGENETGNRKGTNLEFDLIVGSASRHCQRTARTLGMGVLAGMITVNSVMACRVEFVTGKWVIKNAVYSGRSQEGSIREECNTPLVKAI